MDSEQTEPPATNPPTPLPRGRTDLSRDEVAEHQRERVLSAVAVVISAHGYPGMTVERVISAARVSRTTFYQLFDNKQHAVLAAHELIFERFFSSIRSACGGEGGWPGKVDAAVAIVIEFALAHPEHAQFLTAEFLAADSVIADRARQSHDQLAGLLAGARQEYPQSASFPAGLESATIGGLRSLLARGLSSGQPEDFTRMHRELVQITLLPYLGEKAMQAR